MSTKVTKQENYLALISKNQKQLEKEVLEDHAEDAKYEIDQVIGATGKELREAKKALRKAMVAVPYDAKTEIDATITVENLERGLEIAKKIKAARHS